ncbi:hypothetical protein [Pseudoroseicyclus tamaricis]|uniref:Uncharacterized protein n=1 Tax=Pseudoroseicyclus tamaricis TaxID=2705421 RepID=A0A6B2JVL2_9RHOB|nr:hypothetical protein [Pseudoroseicyclus tamaricis]NDV01935.1 hypothetical protein [Pseudoroseicyclus tamaricis]
MTTIILIAILGFVLLFSLGAYLGYRATRTAQTRPFEGEPQPGGGSGRRG